MKIYLTANGRTNYMTGDDLVERALAGVHAYLASGRKSVTLEFVKDNKDEVVNIYPLKEKP